MRAHLAIAAGLVVLGASAAGQQSKHLNPMVDLLSANKAIFGLGVPTVGRGGGNRGGQGAAQAGGAATAGTAATAAPAPSTPAAPPKTPLELAKDESHTVFFKGGGYQPQMLVLESREQDGEHVLAPADLCSRLVLIEMQPDVKIEVDPDA